MRYPGRALTPGAGHYAVVGAGILGATVAMCLAEQGMRVTLLDKDVPCSGATKYSLAWLNANNKPRSSYHELNAQGVLAWKQLAERLDGDLWYRPVGNLEWRVADKDRVALVERVKRLVSLDYPAELVDASTARRLEPVVRIPETETEFAWFPHEGYVLVEPLIDKLISRAVECGATVLTGRRGHVIGFDTAGNAVSAVHTAGNETIPVDAVVCTAGHWTPQLIELTSSETRIPLVSWEKPEATPTGVRATGLVVRVVPAPAPKLRRVLHAPGINLRLHANSVVHLEPSRVKVDSRITHDQVPRLAREVLDQAREVVSCLDHAEIVEQRVCVRPVPTDGYPIVGWIPGITGAYVMVTHSAVTLGAHLTHLAVDELINSVERHELASYRPGRDDAHPLH